MIARQPRRFDPIQRASGLPNRKPETPPELSVSSASSVVVAPPVLVLADASDPSAVEAVAPPVAVPVLPVAPAVVRFRDADPPVFVLDEVDDPAERFDDPEPLLDAPELLVRDEVRLDVRELLEERLDDPELPDERLEPPDDPPLLDVEPLVRFDDEVVRLLDVLVELPADLPVELLLDELLPVVDPEVDVPERVDPVLELLLVRELLAVVAPEPEAPLELPADPDDSSSSSLEGQLLGSGIPSSRFAT